ncbi:uncharacterized protein PRCAT00002146001 [Priceomyces carsonii]|uniref:uncharacterized protein n=1 Tax=Priceomyces carsonii TaxID=28549 RepID=UPI002ED79664|nr:unnamed protein product [Priceomyces carsonii]
MSTYSDKNFNSKHYNEARPTYPDAFYKTLIAYHEESSNDGKKDLAVDVGCGSGFVTFKLLDYFSNVIGTDLSQTMVTQCKQDPRSQGPSACVKFYEAPAEAFPSEINEGSIDLITGAECIHWVNHAKFFKESSKMLKKGGTLAYWFYKDPIFVNYPKANELYDKYTYGSSRDASQGDGFEKYMGPYWEQPGRNFLRTLLKDVEVPKDLFEDVVRVEFDPHVDGNDSSKTSLYISKKVTLSGILSYVKSWSAYHAWMKDNGDKYNVAEAFVEELRSEMGWDDSFEFEIVFATAYTFARKK